MLRGWMNQMMTVKYRLSKTAFRIFPRFVQTGNPLEVPLEIYKRFEVKVVNSKSTDSLDKGNNEQTSNIVIGDFHYLEV